MQKEEEAPKRRWISMNALNRII